MSRFGLKADGVLEGAEGRSLTQGRPSGLRSTSLHVAVRKRVIFMDAGQIIEDIEPEKLFNSLLNERISFTCLRHQHVRWDEVW